MSCSKILKTTTIAASQERDLAPQGLGSAGHNFMYIVKEALSGIMTTTDHNENIHIVPDQARYH